MDVFRDEWTDFMKIAVSEPEGIVSKSAGRDGRRRSVRFSMANTSIEGGSVLPETEALLESWAQGKIDDDELMARTLQRFGPDA